MDSILSQTAVAPRTRFWASQFEGTPTRLQDQIDVTFGLILPILCFIADPIVFKSAALFGPALLEDYQFFAYVMSTVQMGFFLVWRTFPKKVDALSPLFAGVFLIGACFSFAIGVAILPTTILTLFILIGVLGLIPFVTAFVYLRTGIRAMRAQGNHVPIASRITVAGLSGVLATSALVLGSMFVENSISHSVDTLIYGNGVEAKAAASRLSWFPFIPLKQTDRIASAYDREWSTEKKATLERVYWELTGEDVGLRARMMSGD